MKKMKYANPYTRFVYLVFGIPFLVAGGAFLFWMIQYGEDFECKIILLLFGIMSGIYMPVHVLIFHNYILFGKYTFDAEKVTFKLGKRVYSIKWESCVDAGIVHILVGKRLYARYFYISTAYQDRKKKHRLRNLACLARQRHHQDIIYFDVDPDELPEIIEYLPASVKPRVIYDALRNDLPVKHEAEQ